DGAPTRMSSPSPLMDQPKRSPFVRSPSGARNTCKTFPDASKTYTDPAWSSPSNGAPTSARPPTTATDLPNRAPAWGACTGRSSLMSIDTCKKKLTVARNAAPVSSAPPGAPATAMPSCVPPGGPNPAPTENPIRETLASDVFPLEHETQGKPAGKQNGCEPESRESQGRTRMSSGDPAGNEEPKISNTALVST